MNANDLALDKIVPIGPLTAIKVFSLAETIWYAGLNFIKAFGRIKHKKWFLSNYKALRSRPSYSDYYSKQEKKNHVFFASSLWKKERAYNETRNEFISVCKNLKELNFEGGFSPRVGRRSLPA